MKFDYHNRSAIREWIVSDEEFLSSVFEYSGDEEDFFGGEALVPIIMSALSGLALVNGHLDEIGKLLARLRMLLDWATARERTSSSDLSLGERIVALLLLANAKGKDGIGTTKLATILDEKPKVITSALEGLASAGVVERTNEEAWSLCES